jgi:hypothetical protein
MGLTAFVPVADMALLPLSPMSDVYGVDAALMTLTALTPSYVWELPGVAQKIFLCILTGEGDGLDDLTIPIESFTATVRDGDPSYLSCKIPNGSAYESDILARPAGDIVIRFGLRLDDGTEQTEEIVRVNYEAMQIERSGILDVLIMTGHKTTTTGQSKEWTVGGVSYVGLDIEGKHRIRAEIDWFLRPGDICTYGDGAGDYMTVGGISYAVAARPVMMLMEIEEA